MGARSLLTIAVALLLAISMVDARAHPGKKATESIATTEAPAAPTPPPNGPTPSEVVAQVQATVAEEAMKEAQAAAAVDFEIERAQELVVVEEAQRAAAAAAAEHEIAAAEAVQRDAAEALAVMNELNTIGGDLAPQENRWGGGWGGYPAYGGYQGYGGGWNNGWNGYGGGGYYGGYNPYRRQSYEPWYGGYGGGYYPQHHHHHHGHGRHYGWF